MVSRRRFFEVASAACAVTAFTRSRAAAAQFAFIIGGDQPIELPASVRATQMWRTIEQESNGRISARVFPNNELGNDPSMLSQLRSGALQFFLAATPVLSAVVPVAEIANIGFAFRDADEALRVMDGPLGELIRRETATKGMYLLPGMWDSGMRGIGAVPHPIRTADDLRGFKIRVVGRITIDLFKALGASPVPLSINELYTALQTHLVDGEDTPLATKQGAHLYEVEKYLSLTYHSWSGIWLAANADVWKSLPPDLQAIILRNQAKFTILERADTKALNASIADKLGRQGMVVNTVDPASFRAPLKAYYDTWASAFGPAWSVLESSLNRKLS